MSLIPTLLAVVVGTILGLRWGGGLENLTAWRPPLLPVLAGGLLLGLFVDLVGLSGGFAAFLMILATAAILAFAVINVRVGGMLLIAIGYGVNLVVMIINWGTPVSGSALISSGIVKRSELANVAMTGGRHVADGATLGFLGDVIGLPWGHVISIADIFILVGIVLVTASVIRRYSVPGGPNAYRNHGGPQDYRSALNALGRGPAPRRGPGLHPSRMSERTRRRPGRAPRPGSGPR